ncbi:MAG TPA: hypothetical protein PKA95_13480 [Thermomicrobiales bacterium]|mgnify:CR=1 FL=1|nr:hypothetical protein [Thermomicrobiales bacterium]
MGGQRVAVVGHCASGKSTVVAALRERGIDAWAVAQEHSAIAELWRRQSPDALVYLDVSLESIRARRGDPHWPQWLYDVQAARLAVARQQADIVVSTDSTPVESVVTRVITALAGESGGPAAVVTLR